MGSCARVLRSFCLGSRRKRLTLSAIACLIAPFASLAAAVPASAETANLTEPAGGQAANIIDMVSPNAVLFGTLTITVTGEPAALFNTPTGGIAVPFGRFDDGTGTGGDIQIGATAVSNSNPNSPVSKFFTTCDTARCRTLEQAEAAMGMPPSSQPLTFDLVNPTQGTPSATVLLSYGFTPFVPFKELGCGGGRSGAASCGEPIDIASGNMFTQETDYQTSGQNPLTFTRYYNSAAALGVFASDFGLNWRSTFDRYLHLNGPTVLAERADGQVLTFAFGSGVYTPDSDVDVKLTQSGSTWTLTDRDDTVETYSASGTKAILTAIQARNGYTQNLTYNGSNQLTSVTDSYGRNLTFTYQNGLLSTVTTPDGLVLTYSFAASGLRGVGVLDQLTQVAYSTNPSTTRQYVYESTVAPMALTGIIDEDGIRFATWAYDSQGRATSSQHAAGADLTTLVYNSDSSTTVTYPLGEEETYKFTTLQGIPKVTEIDRLASATAAEATRLFTYDSNGYKASETDWNGNQTTYVNDAHGQPTTTTEAVGTPQQRVTTIGYCIDNPTATCPAFHLPSQIVGPRTTTNFTYDANGELLTKSVTDNTVRSVPYSTQGQTRTWTFTWANALLASSKGPRALTAELTQYGYDSSGALTSITDALGHTTQITQHLPGGLPQTIVDPNGVTTQLTYDARQRLTSSTLQGAVPMTTSYGYDAAGNLTQKTLPDGSALTLGYDAAHRLVGITDLDNRRITYTLDALGDRTQTQTFGGAGALRRTQSASFDALGRQLTQVGGASQTTTYAYDSNGNVLTITDPLGRVTQQVFDPLDRKTQITEPNGGVTTIGYNQLDEVNAVTDPMGHTTTYVEDGFGDVIEEVSPDRGTTVYTYNLGGLLTQKVDAAGAVTRQVWDPLDRLATTSYPNDPTENVAYAYDQGANGIGRLTGVSDAAGTLSRSYNLRGLLTHETRTSGAATLSTAYTYDPANRLKTIAYPSGLVVTYSRDNMGRITAIDATTPGTNVSIPAVQSIATLPFGPYNSLTYGDGSVETRGYDLDYRLITLAANNLQNLTYAYDANDNVLSITDGVTQGNSQTFAYNKVNRLNAASGSYGSIAYTYDPVGNRTSQKTTVGANVTQQTYSYAATSNQLLATTDPGGHQFTYSATGNPIEDVRDAATLDFTYNQDNRLAAVSQSGATTAQYVYDAFGQRASKAVPGTTTLYSYDQAGRLIEEDLGGGSPMPVADYIYLGDQPIGLYLPGSGLHFYHDDRLGTPQLVTDAAQNLVWTGHYQPFGPVAITAAITQNLRLPGQYFDAELGWSHNGFRTYAQGLGRYIEADPIGLGGGLDTYAYADANPTGNVDPFGLFPTPPGFGLPLVPSPLSTLFGQFDSDAALLARAKAELKTYKNLLKRYNQIRNSKCVSAHDKNDLVNQLNTAAKLFDADLLKINNSKSINNSYFKNTNDYLPYPGYYPGTGSYAPLPNFK